MSLDYENTNSVLTIFDHQVRKFQDKPYLWRKIDGDYVSLSWREVHNKVCKLSLLLNDFGILKGDRVIIVSENRPEWQIADLAIMAIGAITVPAYITNTTADHEYIIKHSGARAIIVSNDNLLEKVLPAVANATQCKSVIKIDEGNINNDTSVAIFSWSKLLQEKKGQSFDLKVASEKHNRNDTACIIYTSGTGGNPKGVMLSHGAMLTNCTGAQELLKNLSKSKEECNSVEVTRDNDDLQFRKGQLNIIAFVTSLETQVELMVKEHEENL